MGDRLRLALMLPVLPELNTSATRRHTAKQARIAKGLKDTAAVLIGMRTGRQRGNRSWGRPRLTLVRWSSQPADTDNIAVACKPFRDALIDAGLIRDDGPHWLASEYAWAYAPPRSGCTTLVLSGDEPRDWRCLGCDLNLDVVPWFCPRCRRAWTTHPDPSDMPAEILWNRGVDTDSDVADAQAHYALRRG